MKNTKRSQDGKFSKGNLPWNTGGFPDWAKKKMSEARMKSEFRTGEKHPKWNGGSRGFYKKFAEETMRNSGNQKVCSECSSENRIHIHHKDRDYKNNDISNLVYLCLSCHLKVHHREDVKNNVCLVCKTEFQSGRRTSKFCSTRCRCRNWKQRRLTGEKV
jgi:hypothetical protein